MISPVLTSALLALLLVQGQEQPSVGPAALPTGSPEVAPAIPGPATPTDGFGPDLKAWLDANKRQDEGSAAKALADLQRRRAERSLFNVDDVAGAIAGRAEVRALEGTPAEATDLLDTAIGFAPDSAAYQVRKAALQGKVLDAWRAVSLTLTNPLEKARLTSTLLLALLAMGGVFAAGFSLALVLRYVAVFSHDVAESLSGPLRSLALFMAVLFIALPLAVFLGWGYLPFWWMALFFIFQSRQEKAVSLVLLVSLALSSLTVPLLNIQRAIDAAPQARPLYLVANGGTSVEGEAIVRARVAGYPEDPDWLLLSANLSRRAGRFGEAEATLLARADADPRFAHNAAVLEVNKGNFSAALPALTTASGASLSSRDQATALYNLSLVQLNALKFEESKQSRTKGDELDAPLLARYDRLLWFDRTGSTLQAPPDITPDPSKVIGRSIPAPAFTPENAFTRVALVAIVLLLLIPAVGRFRGRQSFSKQCPKCGTTFCWLCQTRSTSQDVCSQCHHLFVVKRGIPPAARAAKNAEITNFITFKALRHRIASLVAPGCGHLSVGHFNFGLLVLLAWAFSVGGFVTLHYLAPLIVAGSLLGPILKTGFGVIAAISYVAAQVVKPEPPVLVSAPRRTRPEPEA